MSRRFATVWIDLCLAVLIGAGAGSIAFDKVLSHYTPNLGADDTFRLVAARVAPYREDLLYPCIGEFGKMAEPAALSQLPEWRAFLTNATDRFPCEALAQTPIVPVAYNFWLHRNLHSSLSTVFAVTGPTLAGFAYYQAIQYGVFLALIYGVFRLGMGRLVAAAAMLPLAISPRHLDIALAPIEYAKAPFFAACLFGVAVLVAVRLPARRAYLVAAATGVAVGIGFGCKPDVLVFAPFGVFALLAFAPQGDDRSPRRLLLVASYILGVAVAGAPLIQSHFFGTQRSLLPIQVMGGMAPGFTHEYAEPSLYDYGIMFDDDHVIAVINSYHQRVNGATEFGPFFAESLNTGATDLLLRLERTFPADLVVRTYAAILQILQFVPGGALVALAVLVGLCRTNLRLTSFILFTLAYMVGYVSLVFAPKHYFHLEFVPWWFTGCAVSFAGAFLWRRLVRPAPALPPPDAAPPRSWPAVLAMAAAAVGVLGGALMIARLYQDREVRALITDYTAGPVEPLTARMVDLSPTARLVIPEGVPVDDSGAAPAPVGQYPAPEVQTDYVVLRLECLAAQPAALHTVYRRPLNWREVIAVPCERPQQQWTVMWPVYQHLPHQVFDGFEQPADSPLRVVSAGRVRDVADYPLLLRLQFPDDWQARPWHHTLNWTKVSPWRVRPAPGALSPPPPPPLPPPAVAWDPPHVRGFQPLAIAAPAIDSWTPVPGVSVAANGDSRIVHGDNTTVGYQLVSPRITVPPRARMRVRVYGNIEQGRVAFGILDGTGARWLMPATWGRSDFIINTESYPEVALVFANARQAADPAVASRFSVQSITYDFESAFFDSLRALLWPAQ